jgi:hypothetical protein
VGSSLHGTGRDGAAENEEIIESNFTMGMSFLDLLNRYCKYQRATPLNLLPFRTSPSLINHTIVFSLNVGTLGAEAPVPTKLPLASPISLSSMKISIALE